MPILVSRGSIKSEVSVGAGLFLLPIQYYNTRGESIHHSKAHVPFL